MRCENAKTNPLRASRAVVLRPCEGPRKPPLMGAKSAKTNPLNVGESRIFQFAAYDIGGASRDEDSKGRSRTTPTSSEDHRDCDGRRRPPLTKAQKQTHYVIL